MKTIPPDLNLPAVREALKADPGAAVREPPGLNHLFQTARTGAPSEYGGIEETLSPSAREVITRSISERVAS